MKKYFDELLVLAIIIASMIYMKCNTTVQTTIKCTSIVEEQKFNGTFSDFKDAIAFKESSNNYQAENKYGYVGRYQFGRLALTAVGLNNVSKNKFKNDHKLQESAFESLLSINKYLLTTHIKNYDGKIVNGVKITESGVLAAAHLVGAKSIKRFLESNGKIERSDANNVKLTKYMQMFANYDTTAIQAKCFEEAQVSILQ